MKVRFADRLGEVVEIMKTADGKKSFAILCAAGLVTECVNIQILAAARAWVVDSVISKDYLWFVLGLCGVLAFNVFSSASIIMIDYLVYRIALKTRYSMRNKVVASLLGVKDVPKDVCSGDFIITANDDIDSYCEIFGLAYLCVASVGRTAGALIIGFSLSWQLSVFILLSGVINLFLQKRKAKPLHELSKDLRKVESSYLNHLYDRVRNHGFVKLMGNRGRLESYLGERKKEYANVNRRLGYVNGSIFLLSTGISIAVTVCVIAIGSFLSLAGAMTTGAIVAFIGLQGALMDPYTYFSDFIKGYGGIKASFERLQRFIRYEVKDAPLEPALYGGTRSTEAPSIELDGVVFGYDGNKQIVDGLSARFEAGSVSYLIGRSGAGKTTVFRLIMGLETPHGGTVIATAGNFRANPSEYDVVMVSQSSFLFNGTILENITMTGDPIDMDAVRIAARKAGILDEIEELDGGFYARVVDGGKTLSGGQRMRICLARAFYRKANILLLDEVLASIDEERARYVLRSIEDEATDGACVVMITHRHDLIPEGAHVVALP